MCSCCGMMSFLYHGLSGSNNVENDINYYYVSGTVIVPILPVATCSYVVLKEDA